MRTSLECWECYAHTFGNIVKSLAKDEKQAYEIICRLVNETADHYKNDAPADVGTVLNKVIMEYFNDPFRSQKKESTEIAKKVFYKLLNVDLNIENAVRISLFGNIMDYSVKGWDPQDININSILNINIAINHIDFLEKELSKAQSILFLTDNAGEIILDYFFIKYIKLKGIKVILSPKKGPIQNDATVEDIKETPVIDIVDEIVPVAQAVGLDYNSSSNKFKEIFNNSDLIIFKGMGYFENAYKYDINSFFILKAKCEPVARCLGVNKGDNIVLGKHNYYGNDPND